MKKPFHRPLAILLAVCMLISVTQSFAFAQETEGVTDAIASVSEGVPPSLNASDCTCDPAPGTSGVEGHGEGCPLYVAPEPPGGECTCPPVDSGEVVHGEDCPLYVKPAVPETKCICTVLCTAEAANADCPVCGLGFEKCGYIAEKPDAAKAVLELIAALPTIDELALIDTEGAEFPAYLEKLRTDVSAARGAYDALTEAEKAAFDPAALAKLAALEEVLAAMPPMLMAAQDPAPLDTNNAYQNVKYALDQPKQGEAAVNNLVSGLAVTGDNENLTIPKQVKATDGTTYNVTKINNNAFVSRRTLASVTVPATIQTIGSKAFTPNNTSVPGGMVVTLEHTGPLPAGIDAYSFMTSGNFHFYLVIADPTFASALGDKCLISPDECYGMIVAEEPVNPTFENTNSAGTLKAAAPEFNSSKGNYDVNGLNDSTVISTTSIDGYDSILCIGDNPSFNLSSRLRLPGAGVESYVKSGIWAKVDTDFIADGKYLRVTYTLRNSTDADIEKVSLAVSSDVQIGTDTKATIKPTPTGFRMVNTKTGDPGSGMQFVLNCTDTSGADDVSAMWYGMNSSTLVNYYFKNLDSKIEFAGMDTALAFSWQNMTIPQHDSITRSVLFGVGEDAAPPELPAEKPFDLKVSTDLTDLKVTAKVTDTAGLVDTLYYTVNGGAEAMFGSATATGSEIEIVGTIPQNALNTGDNSVSVWVMNDKGAMSESVTFKITVKDDGAIDNIDGAPPEVDYIPTDSITLDKTTATLKIPATVQLNATVRPDNATDKTVTWSSSAPAVATVSTSGLVTAVGAGTTTITAKAKDNQTATCEVTVIAPVTITATPTHATTYGGADGKITITASGGQGTYQYSKDNSTWQDSDTFTGLTARAYTVYARDKADTANVSAATEVTVKQPSAKPVVVEDTANTDKDMTYGDLLKLGVTATAPDGGTLTYQWYEVVSGSSKPIDNANEAAYAPTNITRIAAGDHKYYCIVTNTKDGASGPATNNLPYFEVTVSKHTPTATLAASSTTPTYGDEITLTATVNAASGGLYPAGTVTFKDGTTELAVVNVTRADSGHGEAKCTYKIPVNHGVLTAEYSGDTNYNASTATAAAVTVRKKALTVTAEAKTITYGEAAPTYTATYSGFITGEAEANLGGTLAFDCAYTKFDDAKGYDITPSRLTSDNYAITFTKGTLTVNQKEIGLAWQEITTREYDGEPSNVTATATGTVNGDQVGVTVNGGTNSTVATHTATATGLTDATGALRAFFGATDKSGNYKLPAAKTTNYTIDPCTITMKLDTASFEYDGTEKTVTATVTNPVGNEAVTVTLSGDKKTIVGEYTATAVSLGGANAGNYRLGTPPPTATWKITGKQFPYTVNPPTASDITYGQPLSASTLTGDNSDASVRFSLLALMDSQGVDKTGSFAWKDADAGKILAAGEHTIAAVFTPADKNYSPVDCDVTVTVNKAPVTLEVSGTKVYGTAPIADADYTVDNITGMVNSETDPALLGTLAFTSGGNEKAAAVGSYDIAIAQSGTSNYDVTTKTAVGKFTVTEAEFTVVITPYRGVYDGEEHPRVIVDTQPGDIVTYYTTGPNFIDKVPTIKDASKRDVKVKVTRANHKDYTPIAWQSAIVTAREVAVEFTLPENLVYNGEEKTVTAEITNKCGTDDVDLTLDNPTGKAVGDYTTVASALTGAAAGNYKLPNPNPSVTWAITGTPYPDEITLPTASGITYGQKLSDSVLTQKDSKGVFDWNDGKIVPHSGEYTATVVFKPTDKNFASVTREVKVTVAKAEVTLEVSGTKVYHTAPIANADYAVSNISGMVNGETDPALLGSLTFTSDGNTVDAPVKSYDIAIAQSGTSNYTVTTRTVTGKFTVTAAKPTLSGTASYQKLLTDKDFALDVKTDSTDADAVVVYSLTNDGGGAVTLDADGKTLRLHKTGTATITANSAATANFTAAAPLTINVTVGSMPLVRIHAAEGITTTGAKIGGTITGGTIAVTEYGLQYKKSSDTDYTAISPTETVNGDVKTLAYSLVGLEKDTEYSVRIWAKTADKTFESLTRFRTAAEKPPTGSVEGEIKDESGTKTAITVTIEAGNTVIASHTVNAGGGKFTFEALPDGFYNLVADNGRYKVTRMVQVVKGGAVTDVTMTIGKTQSVVEVKGEDTPKVAVDGLPELFENDTLFTQDNKDVIAAGGTVEFKLTVEQEENPADADKFDKLEGGKVGIFLDIQVLKTVTDANGRADAPEPVSDLAGNSVTIVIPLTKELQGKESYTVYSVHDGGAAEKIDSEYSAEQNTLTIATDKFSTYAIAYTEKSGGTGGGSDGSSHDDDNYDFWQKVKDKINSAEDGDTVKAGAGGYDKMPESVMDALRKNPDVTLVIDWNGGDRITIPAGKAAERDGLRIYYPLAYLEELYRDILPDANRTNPETGGVTEINAPAAAQAPAITTPKNEGTADTPERAQTERAAIEAPPAAPEIAPIPAIEAETEAAPIHSGTVAVILIVITFAAAGIVGILLFWKKKHKEEAI